MNLFEIAIYQIAHNKLNPRRAVEALTSLLTDTEDPLSEFQVEVRDLTPTDSQMYLIDGMGISFENDMLAIKALLTWAAFMKANPDADFRSYPNV